MRDGFVKVAAVTPKIRVADTKYNAGVIVEGIREAAARLLQKEQKLSYFRNYV